MKQYIVNYKSINNDIAFGGFIDLAHASELVKDGVKTVIDLRTIEEGVEDERKVLSSLAIDYHNIPVGREGINLKMLQEFASIVTTCAKPLLIHCASGYRVEAMWHLYKAM